MNTKRHIIKKILCCKLIPFATLSIALGLFMACGQEAIDGVASAALNTPEEVNSNETTPEQFMFISKGSKIDFSALDSYRTGTLDSIQDSSEECDAIPLNSSGQFEFEFVSEDGTAQYLSTVKSSAVPGSGSCTYTMCDTFGTCGNWFTGYYGCCTHESQVSAPCAV